MWYKINDSIVTVVDESVVLRDAAGRYDEFTSAYMLQYVSIKELVSGNWHESTSVSTATATTSANAVNSLEDEELEEAYAQLESVDGGEDIMDCSLTTVLTAELDSSSPTGEAVPSLPASVDEDNVEDDSPLLASFRAMCTNEEFVEDDAIDSDDDDTDICDDSNAGTTTDAHIMTRLLHIPQKQIDLVEKYKDNEAPVVRAVITSFHTIEETLHKIEDSDTDESTRQALGDKLHTAFDEDYAKVMMDELTGIANLGQDFSKLDVKKFGVLFAFAIESSKRYKGTAPYDRMDLLNCCIMYFLRHTVYSILLEGKTDKDVLTTDMAEEFFLQHAKLFDFNTVCCEATKDCPEGNKYPEMWKQLKNRSNQWNIEKQDAEAFWSLAGNINVDYRAVACKVSLYHVCISLVCIHIYVLL